MAYLAFNFDTAARHDELTPAAVVGRQAHAEFSTVEWTIIQLARKEDVASIKSSSGLAVMIRNLFGLPVANPLANPELELLRRTAIGLWHGQCVIPRKAAKALLEAGYSMRQLALLHAHIHEARAPEVRAGGRSR